MARRRNLSTAISDDRELNDVASSVGDFAALLYTWAIPHAEDNRSLPGEPDDLLYLVMPRRRDKTPADVERAIRSWVAAGLVDWVRVGRKRLVFFKADSFYRIQDKVPRDRRFFGLPEGAEPVGAVLEAEGTAKTTEPLSRADAAKPPQNAAAAANSPLARALFASLPEGSPHGGPSLTPSAYGAAEPDAVVDVVPLDVGQQAKALATSAYDALSATGRRPSSGKWVGRAIGAIKQLTPAARAEFPAAVMWALELGRPGHIAAWLSSCRFGELLDAYRLRDAQGQPTRVGPPKEPASWAALRELAGGDGG